MCGSGGEYACVCWCMRQCVDSGGEYVCVWWCMMRCVDSEYAYVLVYEAGVEVNMLVHVSVCGSEYGGA